MALAVGAFDTILPNTYIISRPRIRTERSRKARREGGPSGARGREHLCALLHFFHDMVRFVCFAELFGHDYMCTCFQAACFSRFKITIFAAIVIPASWNPDSAHSLAESCGMSCGDLSIRVLAHVCGHM